MDSSFCDTRTPIFTIDGLTRILNVISLVIISKWELMLLNKEYEMNIDDEQKLTTGVTSTSAPIFIVVVGILVKIS